MNIVAIVIGAFVLVGSIKFIYSWDVNTYKINHRLFGHDYIYWENSAASGIAQVEAKGDKAVYWRYKGTVVLDEIKKESQVIWLTCEPSKYLKE